MNCMTERNALVEECAKIAEPWSGALTGDKMGAMDREVVQIRQDIANAIRTLMVDRDPTAKANLGLATTRELLAELSARIEIHATGGLDYRTVDGEALGLLGMRTEAVKP